MLNKPKVAASVENLNNPLVKLNMMSKCFFYWFLTHSVKDEVGIEHHLPLTSKLTMTLSNNNHTLEVVICDPSLRKPTAQVFRTIFKTDSALLQVKQLLEKLLETQLLGTLVDECEYFFYHFEKEFGAPINNLSTAMFNSIKPSKVAAWYLRYLAKNPNNFGKPTTVYETINRPSFESNQSKVYGVVAHRINDEVYFTLTYESNSFTTHTLIHPDFDWKFYGFNVNWLVSDLMDPKFIADGRFHRTGKEGTPYPIKSKSAEQQGLGS